MTRRTWCGGAILAVLAIACATPGKRAATGVAGVPPGIVDGPTARKLVASGVKVVDVRNAAEFATGHVPGALLVPHDQIAARHGEIGPPSTPVLVYCGTGRRSAIAARTLADLGFSTIYDMQSYGKWVASEPRDATGSPAGGARW